MRTIDPRANQTTWQNGYTLIEMLVALALSAILFAGLGSVVGQVIDTREAVHENNDLTQQARFALQQMVHAVSRSPRLLLPLNDNPNTNWPEHIREEPALPIAPGTRSTAVLAVTLDPAQDLDGDGWADANNDKDYLDHNNNNIRDNGEPERLDEDPGPDNTNDAGQGIAGIDDDGDGLVDEGTTNAEGLYADNDEDGNDEDDLMDGMDNDLDGSVDEDLPGDINGDTKSGIASIDDDRNNSVDEGDRNDDDEDGTSNEDWYDPVVFYLDGDALMQRTPVPWDESGGGSVSGLDYISVPIAENVTRFRVERLPQNGDRAVTVDLTLELTSPATGEAVSLNTRIRSGGAL